MKRRRIAVLLTAAAAIITGAVVPAAAASSSSPALTLTGTAAGDVGPGGYVAFAFTLTNTTNHTILDQDLAIMRPLYNTQSHDLSCNLNGMDGKWCEPGELRAQESMTVLALVQVKDQPTTPLVVRVRACAENEDTGAQGPCRLRGVPIGG